MTRKADGSPPAPGYLRGPTAPHPDPPHSSPRTPQGGPTRFLPLRRLWRGGTPHRGFGGSTPGGGERLGRLRGGPGLSCRAGPAAGSPTPRALRPGPARPGPEAPPPPPAAKQAAPAETRHPRGPPCPAGRRGPRQARRKGRSGILLGVRPGRAGPSRAGPVLRLPVAAARGDVAQNPAPRALSDPVRRVPPARMQAVSSAAAVSFQRPNRLKPA